MSQEEGDYAFCLDNTFSRFSNKVVFFELITDTEESYNIEDYNLQEIAEEDYEVKLEDFKVWTQNVIL